MREQASLLQWVPSRSFGLRRHARNGDNHPPQKAAASTGTTIALVVNVNLQISTRNKIGHQKFELHMQRYLIKIRSNSTPVQSARHIFAFKQQQTLESSYKTKPAIAKLKSSKSSFTFSFQVGSKSLVFTLVLFRWPS